ncbi:MAG TPA: YtxH domain-containing protein [Flavobacterium sp.]|nr:YtxH domain-containing protein [Flavobacterium sp.]
MSSKTGIGLALLAGVAIGAGIGILMAPDKGSKTRGKIKGGYDDAKSDLKNKFNLAKDKFTKADVEGKYENLVSDLSSKSEDVITFLESKLAALKKEVAKY